MQLSALNTSVSGCGTPGQGTLLKLAAQGVARKTGGTLLYIEDSFTGAYQDSAGTTPVTALTNPVGLLTDRSYNGELGAELVSNGDFSAGSTGWTTSGGFSISGGAASSTGGSSTLATGSPILTVGKTYVAEWDSGATSSINVTFGFNYVSSANTVGRNRVVGVCTNNGTFGFQGGGTYAGIDNISVKELKGNHAAQSTAGNRPLVAALNGHNALQCDGSNDSLATSVLTGTSGTLIVAAKAGILAMQCPVGSGGTNSAEAGVAIKFRSDGAIWFRTANGSATADSVASSAHTLGSPVVVTGDWNTTQQNLYVNGTSRHMLASAVAASTGQIQVGRHSTGGSEPFNGAIDFVFYSPSVLSDADRKAIEKLAAYRVGVTLA